MRGAPCRYLLHEAYRPGPLEIISLFGFIKQSLFLYTITIEHCQRIKLSMKHLRGLDRLNHSIVWYFARSGRFSPFIRNALQFSKSRGYEDLYLRNLPSRSRMRFFSSQVEPQQQDATESSAAKIKEQPILGTASKDDVHKEEVKHKRLSEVRVHFFSMANK